MSTDRAARALADQKERIVLHKTAARAGLLSGRWLARSQFKVAAEWARDLGAAERTIRTRLDDGWPEEQAVTTPIGAPRPPAPMAAFLSDTSLLPKAPPRRSAR